MKKVFKWILAGGATLLLIELLIAIVVSLGAGLWYVTQ